MLFNSGRLASILVVNLLCLVVQSLTPTVCLVFCYYFYIKAQLPFDCVKNKNNQVALSIEHCIKKKKKNTLCWGELTLKGICTLSVKDANSLVFLMSF